MLQMQPPSRRDTYQIVGSQQDVLWIWVETQKRIEYGFEGETQRCSIAQGILLTQFAMDDGVTITQ